MPQKHTPLARQSNLVIQELPDELLIYDLKINRAICLNSVSALVWQLCDGRNSVQEISRKISEKLGDLLNEDVVHLAIYQLNKNSLLKMMTGLTKYISKDYRAES